jgi:hypothetical protein
VPPMNGTSFWLTLELVRIADYCYVWRWCNLKHEKVEVQVGTRSAGLDCSLCQLIPLSVRKLPVNFYQSDLFISILRSQIMRTCKNRSDRSNTRLDAPLRYTRAVRKCGRSTRSAAKDFRIPFRILAIYCNRVRQTDVTSTSPTLSINTGYIQQI